MALKPVSHSYNILHSHTVKEEIAQNQCGIAKPCMIKIPSTSVLFIVLFTLLTLCSSFSSWGQRSQTATVLLWHLLKLLTFAALKANYILRLLTMNMKLCVTLNYVLLTPAVQPVHWQPGGRSVSLRHEGSPSSFPAWRTATGIGKLWRTQWETPLPSRDPPSTLSHPLPSFWLSNSPPQTTAAACLSGVCGVSIQPILTATKPLVSLWSLRFSGGVFLCASVCYFLLLSTVTHVMFVFSFGRIRTKSTLVLPHCLTRFTERRWRKVSHLRLWWLVSGPMYPSK